MVVPVFEVGPRKPPVALKEKAGRLLRPDAAYVTVPVDEDVLLFFVDLSFICVTVEPESVNVDLSFASNHNEQPLKEVGVNPGYGTLVINLDISSRCTHYKTGP